MDGARLDDLVAATRSLAGPGIGVGGALLARGGTAAALALAGGAIGHASVEPSDRRPSGRPIWSATVVGAVTHDRELALALLARRHVAAGVGIDLERLGALPEEDARAALLTPGEVWGPVDERDPVIRLAAKEAAFKAVAGALDITPPGAFAAVAVVLHGDGRFGVVRDDGVEVDGRWTLVGHDVLTVARIAPR